MNIAIIGRGDLLYATARLSLQRGHVIKLIVTAKDAPEYRSTVKDFALLAKEVGACFLNTHLINDQSAIGTIKGCGAIDIGVSINYVNVISQEVIDLFRLGILNCHGGDLPRYRGNACTAWALLNGEERIANCIHRMEGLRLDSGDIICREYLAVDINTRIKEVYDWFEIRSPMLFMDALERLDKDPGYYLERQSSDPAKALRCYPRIPEDGKIDWHCSAVVIVRLVNASSEPYSGAFCFFEGRQMIIWRAELCRDNEHYCSEPGQISGIDKDGGSVTVISGNGKVRVCEIEYRGRRCKPAKVITGIRKRLC
ncbi:MAG: hypothetical protein NDI81_08350 [Desulfobacula sp.]|nr:hypothetical protein [Desulfobacula sp.]